MIKKYIFSLIILLQNSVFAQYIISGQIKDAENNQNIQYCNIALINKNKIVSGCITNEKGFFTLNVNKGNYKIIISFIGYQTDTINTGLIYEDKFLGVFKIKKYDKYLKEVEISESKIVNAIDKDIVNITDYDRKESSELGDILDKVQGITYDRLNNAIKVDNNSNVKMLLNNIEKDRNYIININPNKIKQIEIIRYPGGKYGLDNYDAIINVITYKKYEGYDININNMSVFDLDNKSVFFSINNFDATYNYTHNKFNYYFGIVNNYKHFNINQSSLYSDDSIKIINTSIEPYSLKAKSYDNNLLLGVDYYINPKSSISFETKFIYPKNNTLNSFYKVEKSNIVNDSIISQYNFIQNSNTTSRSTNNFLFYRNKINQNTYINLSYNLTFIENNLGQDIYINENITNSINNINSSVKSYINADFNHSFNTKVSMDIGGDYIYIKDENKYKYYNVATDSIFINNIVRNNIYSYVNWNLNNKFGIKLGAAAENYRINNKKDVNNYYIVQPLFNLRYLINKMVTIRLNYNVKSFYPSSQQISPYTVTLNHNSYRKGNPNLTPSYIHKFNITLNMFKNMFSINPYYNFSNNYITQFITTKNERNIYTFKNIKDYSQKGIKFNLTLNIKRIFILKSSLDIFNSKIKYNQYNNDLNDWTCNNQLIYINKKIKTMFFLNYQKESYKIIDLNGYKTNNMDYWMFGTRNRFLKNRLTLMFMYILPLNWGVDYKKQEYHQVNSTLNSNIYDISVIKNFFMIKLNYRLGNGSPVKKIEKERLETNEKKGLLF